MILHISFFFFFLSLTSTVLTPVVWLVEFLESDLFLYYFFFLSFLTLFESSKSWLEVDWRVFEILKSFP